MVDAKCNIIVTVGFLLSDDTLAAAKKNPDIKFAIVDNNDPKTYPAAKNLKPLVFNTAQSSFLAGYLAAGMSKTKKVGTFGGAKIPTVTIFMDGFSQGVDYYNKQKSADVKVLGWDPAKQDGQFTGDFEDQKGGQRTAEGLISQGADIIFPVAGPAGLGALQAAKASGGKVNGHLGGHRRLRERRELLLQHHPQCATKGWMWPYTTRSRRPTMALSPMSRMSALWRTTAPAWHRSMISSPRFPRS